MRNGAGIHPLNSSGGSGCGWRLPGGSPAATRSGRSPVTCGADARAVEGFGLCGGDIRGAGEDLGQQAQQVCAFAGGQRRQDALLQDADAGKQLVGGGPAIGGDLDAPRPWRRVTTRTERTREG